MRVWLLLIPAISLSACSEEHPLDCDIAEQEVYACIDQLGQMSDLEGYEKCVPLAKPQRFRGTWATDFEFNAFYSGKILAPEDAWKHREVSTRLWGMPLEKYEADGLANVLEVEFVGRRPVCNFTEPVRDIIVDKVIDVRVIEERRSEW